MLTLALQAGGQSRRMGQEKGLMPFRGITLIERVLQRLSPLADEILITTNQPEKYAFLGLPMVKDVLPGRGSIGGLLTALTCATHSFVAVAACDMPFANLPLFRHQLELLQNHSAEAVVPLLPGGYEPLHAVYRRDPCLQAVTLAIQSDQWRLTGWIPSVNILSLSAADCAPYDPSGLAFRNVNTPQELAEAENLAEQLD